MENEKVEIINFKAKNLQSLKNVSFYFPSIVWVMEGSKQFDWFGKSIETNKKLWLLIPPFTNLTFKNITFLNSFYSKQLVLPSQIDDDLLKNNKAFKNKIPIIEVDNNMKFLWQSLEYAINQKLSLEIVKQFSNSLLLYLKSQNKLNVLYPSNTQYLKNKVYNYVSCAINKNIKQSEIASFFAMSEATLKRKLTKEGTSFRKIIIEAKMNHSLTLMQENKKSILDLALDCGYKSQSKFSLRFKQQFGIEIKDYLATISYS